MKPKHQFLPPLQSVIFAFTRRMLDETATNAQSFAMIVAEKYLALTAPDVRNVPFKLGDDLAADMRNNGQILRRYMDGTVKSLPADLLDAWILSLPEPYRSDCERALARRRGLLPVKQTDISGTTSVDDLGELTADFGKLLKAIAPALNDGVITRADLPYAQEILDKSDALIAATMSVRGQVQNVLLSSRRAA